MFIPVSVGIIILAIMVIYCAPNLIPSTMDTVIEAGEKKLAAMDELERQKQLANNPPKPIVEDNSLYNLLWVLGIPLVLVVILKIAA